MKNINLDLNLKTISKLPKKAAAKLHRYRVVLFIVAAVGVSGYLVYQIGQASQVEPSQDTVNQQLNTVKRLKIDQNAVDKIQQLEDQNVGVQSLFKSARDNPFQE